MSDPAVKRPPILTGACLYLGALAAIMAIRAVTLVSTWNAENRAADFSGTLRALRDAGLGADGAETFYKAFLTVVAVLAACAVVFAVYTSRGHAASRIGLTVAVGVVGTLTFIGLLGGTFLFAMIGALAVVFTIRLWTGEIRTYFRTLAGHAPPPPRSAPADPLATTPAHPSAIEPAAPGYWPPQGPPPREPLPRSVGIAVWTTFIGSIVAAGFSALMLLAVVLVGVDYESVIEQGGPGADMIRGSEGDFDTALRLLTVLSAISVVLGIAGLLASIQVLVRRRSGDVLLFVLTVVTLIFSVIGFPLGLPWTAAAIVALVHLRKAETRAWFAKT